MEDVNIPWENVNDNDRFWMDKEDYQKAKQKIYALVFTATD